MTTETTEQPETTETVEQPVEDTASTGAQDTPAEPETFPREYVERLRTENGKYRQRAAQADDLAHRLHTALVAATGRLADPSDLPYDDAHLTDEDALMAALDELLTRKPHLAARKPRGDVGQGAGGTPTTVDLAGLLRARA